MLAEAIKACRVCGAKLVIAKLEDCPVTLISCWGWKKPASTSFVPNGECKSVDCGDHGRRRRAADDQQAHQGRAGCRQQAWCEARRPSPQDRCLASSCTSSSKSQTTSCTSMHYWPSREPIHSKNPSTKGLFAKMLFCGCSRRCLSMRTSKIWAVAARFVLARRAVLPGYPSSGRRNIRRTPIPATQLVSSYPDHEPIRG